MPGKAVGRKMNLGIVGSISRSNDNVVVSRMGTGKIEFGEVLILNDDNTVSSFEFGKSLEEKIIGIAVRIVKQEINLAGDVYYEDGEIVDVLVRGSIIVQCNGLTFGAGSNVYIEEIENKTFFTSDETKTKVSNMKFTTGDVSVDSMVEITLITRSI